MQRLLPGTTTVLLAITLQGQAVPQMKMTTIKPS